MIYFSHAPVIPDSIDAAQYNDLLAFRRECESRGLIEAYDTVQEFRKKFSRQLAQLVIREFSAETGDEVSALADSQAERDRNQRDHVVESLTEDARELLVEGSLAENGRIISFRPAGGSLMIQAHGKQFAEPGNSRSAARWEAALQRLLELDLIQDVGHNGTSFRLTNRGYQVADQIRGGVSGRANEMTMQRRAWIEMNDGEDVRGSRPNDDAACAVIEQHGGVHTSSGNCRFPDGSVLRVRRGHFVASPDPGESGVTS